jgi:hypothetical protein
MHELLGFPHPVSRKGESLEASQSAISLPSSEWKLLCPHLRVRQGKVDQLENEDDPDARKRMGRTQTLLSASGSQGGQPLRSAGNLTFKQALKENPGAPQARRGRAEYAGFES